MLFDCQPSRGCPLVCEAEKQEHECGCLGEGGGHLRRAVEGFDKPEQARVDAGKERRQRACRIGDPRQHGQRTAAREQESSDESGAHGVGEKERADDVDRAVAVGEPEVEMDGARDEIASAASCRSS